MGALGGAATKAARNGAAIRGARGGRPKLRFVEAKTYYVYFSAELTTDDRDALRRRRMKVRENAFSVLAPDRGERTAARASVLSWHETSYHVVRLRADSPDDARQRVVDALGGEPDNFSVRA
jgi:hypothetical protein